MNVGLHFVEKQFVCGIWTKCASELPPPLLAQRSIIPARQPFHFTKAGMERSRLIPAKLARHTSVNFGTIGSGEEGGGNLRNFCGKRTRIVASLTPSVITPASAPPPSSAAGEAALATKIAAARPSEMAVECVREDVRTLKGCQR